MAQKKGTPVQARRAPKKPLRKAQGKTAPARKNIDSADGLVTEAYKGMNKERRKRGKAAPLSPPVRRRKTNKK